MEKIITDFDTRECFFSPYLKIFGCWHDLESALLEAKVSYGFIPHTRDIWVRDFMPTEIHAGHFVQFRYDPDYLKDSPHYRTTPKKCTFPMGLQMIASDLNIDGGNIVKTDRGILMTDKIFQENPTIQPRTLVNELENIFSKEVLLLPWDKGERFGHADGMVRMLGKGQILINHYVDFDKSLHRKIHKILSPNFDIVELHFGTQRHLRTSWAYINYLQVGRNLFVPSFSNPLDELAFRQLEDALHLKVHPIDSRGIAKLGGGLNCVSWTFKQK